MAEAKDNKAAKKEVTITGFGGQGIVLAGRILGQAAALGDHKESTLIQSYGPESRGGACSAQVVISDVGIHYPYIKHPDILVCMSQGGYDKYIDDIVDNGILIIDQDLVRPGRVVVSDAYSIPATRMAEELGRKMMANIIMLGFFTAVTKAISLKAAENAVAVSVPKGTEELNLKAFNKGCDYGLATLKGREKKAKGKTGAIS
ncbi:MAG: pyruvate ferredoxin oxidoreductase [Deltaproteobacteria bacterium]|nr:pyruvate ferredoxin oxidoreductase [Deltaproteobacteria bacterium]